MRRPVILTLTLALLAAVAGLVTYVASAAPSLGLVRGLQATVSPDARVRDRLFALLRPVTITNCELERFGERNDGGYLLCGNLLGAVRSGYSYGISGYDGWGCEVSRRLRVPVHEYDCFDTRKPDCAGGNTIFHAECVGAATATIEGRPFDTIARQILANGDAVKSLVLKIDVEGAEWESFLQTPPSVLDRIDQMAVEFHGVQKASFVKVIAKLKGTFHVAHLHINNYSCVPGLDPFPAWAYEVLFVNKRIAETDGSLARLPHPLDAPNNPAATDCQPAPPATR
jgi:hypothetical protein